MIPRLLIRWLVTSLAILAVPALVSGVQVPDFSSALAMAAVLGLLNTLVKPILLLVTLPLTLLTLGLFWLVINALLFDWAGTLVHGIHVASFKDAFVAALWVSAVSWVLHVSIDRRPRGARVGWYARKGSPRSRRVAEQTIDMHEGDDGKWKS